MSTLSTCDVSTPIDRLIDVIWPIVNGSSLALKKYVFFWISCTNDDDGDDEKKFDIENKRKKNLNLKPRWWWWPSVSLSFWLLNNFILVKKRLKTDTHTHKNRYVSEPMEACALATFDNNNNNNRDLYLLYFYILKSNNNNFFSWFSCHDRWWWWPSPSVDKIKLDR